MHGLEKFDNQYMSLSSDCISSVFRDCVETGQSPHYLAQLLSNNNLILTPYVVIGSTLTGGKHLIELLTKMN